MATLRNFFFFFFSFVLAQLMLTTVSQPAFFDRDCPNNVNYTDDSTFKKNLDNVLRSIASDAQRGQVDSRFYNASLGDEPNRVTAMALCRGIVDLERCRSCVNDSAYRILQECPNQKQAVGWYPDCQIRYSNNSIYGVRDSRVMRAYFNTQKASDPIGFIGALRTLLDGLRMEAASGTSINKSAHGEEKVPSPSMDTIYGVVDCFPDLSNNDCNGCLMQLQSYIPNCCNASIGARISATSCQLNYEIQPFFVSFPPPLPPLPSPPSPPSGADVPSPSPPSTEGSIIAGVGNNNNIRTVIIAVVVSILSILILLITILVFLRMRKRRRKLKRTSGNVETTDEISSIETLQYDFEAIKRGTDDFSNENMLGQGGFGAVYKGKLPSGEDIAVKRLASGSPQGAAEFKNEVLLVAKLQHRNLVRLLGFCLHGTERLLIYEFLPNASLDHFIFDSEKRTLLDWERRYKIIGGIARGLLYLHEDSRLRIIHRDLKASNILLDEELNSKIADFGTARLFEVDETQGNTNKVVGTYGYMAPEYVIYGQFSVKSDVFSFGVLVLEIMSGRKNTCFDSDHQNMEHLLSFAWKNWSAGTTTDIIDPTLRNGSRIEMIRYIHIGLLCVQEKAADRPTMASVVLMLSSFSVSLPSPSKPAFFMHTNVNVKKSNAFLNPNHPNRMKSEDLETSHNEASITDLYPR